MAEQMPPDPFSALSAAAASMHELFTAWVGAGFTRTEALQLLCAILTRPPSGGQQ